MSHGKKITIELDDAEAAAFDILRVECTNADPGAAWSDEALAKSMLMTIIHDDLATHHRPERIN